MLHDSCKLFLQTGALQYHELKGKQTHNTQLKTYQGVIYLTKKLDEFIYIYKLFIY